MISFTTAQANAWIAAFIFPSARILAFIATAPLLSNTAIPRRVRLLLGIALVVAIVPSVPPIPTVIPTSGQGILILLQQMLIGIGMGFSMRLVFAGIEMAGDLIGSQMGLGFATLYDPMSASQTMVISNFLSLLTTLIFLSLNGHLVYFATLAESFRAIPIASTPIIGNAFSVLFLQGQKIFMIGVLLSLPIITALLITNLALGVLNRASPQLNLFAVGFPITILMGFWGIALILPNMIRPIEHLFDEGLQGILLFTLATLK